MARLPGGDALDEAGVGVGVRRPPRPAVGVEESRGKQERDALVGVGQRMVLGEMLKQDGGLLDERRVRLDAAERRERGVRRLLGEAVERLAVLVGEALGELEVLGTARASRVREPGAECAHVLVVEVVARTQVVGDLADELVGDARGAHAQSVGATDAWASDWGT